MAGIGHGFGSIDNADLDLAQAVLRARENGSSEVEAVIASEKVRASHADTKLRKKTRTKRGQRPNSTSYQQTDPKVRDGLEAYNRIAARNNLRAKWDPVDPHYAYRLATRALDVAVGRAKPGRIPLSKTAVLVVECTDSNGVKWVLLQNPPSMSKVNAWRPSSRDAYNLLYRDRIRSYENADDVLGFMASWPVDDVKIMGPDVRIRSKPTGHDYVFRFGTVALVAGDDGTLELPKTRWGWQWVASDASDIPPDQDAALTRAREKFTSMVD